MNTVIVGGGGSITVTGSGAGFGAGIGAEPLQIEAAMARSSASVKPAATSTCAVVLRPVGPTPGQQRPCREYDAAGDDPRQDQGLIVLIPAPSAKSNPTDLMDCEVATAWARGRRAL